MAMLRCVGMHVTMSRMPAFKYLSLMACSAALSMALLAVHPLGAELLTELGCGGTADSISLLLAWLEEQEIDNLEQLKGIGDLSRFNGRLLRLPMLPCSHSRREGYDCLHAESQRFLDSIVHGRPTCPARARSRSPLGALLDTPQDKCVNAAIEAPKMPPVKTGPSKTLDKLLTDLPNADDRLAWAERARIQAIAGSCTRSTASTKSGIRSWVKFSRDVLQLQRPYPPPLAGLQAWSQTFRRVLSVHCWAQCMKLSM